MKIDKSQHRLIKYLHNYLQLFGEARTQILLWYAGLMLVFVTFALPVVRQRLFVQVQKRVKDELIEEISEFKNIINKGFKSFDAEDAEQLRRRNETINWEPPQNLQQLKQVFDVHLSDELPDDDVFYIAILNGEFYKSTPIALPTEIDRDSELMQGWKKLQKTSEREIEFDDEDIVSVLYIAEPVIINGKIMGVLILAHTSAGERQEANEALQVVVEVMTVGLIVALVLAWLAAGRILAPLRILTQTTQEINEAELTKRIPVKGGGEIAQLATTFNGMMDRLEVAFAAQRDFVNDAGHELRTPIAIIRGHLELMGDEPHEQEETMAIVMDELDRMTRFVDDLVLLAKSEHPDFLLLEKVDISVFTEELLNKARALAPRNWELDGIANGEMWVDRQRLTQAVMNLAQNATQHTQHGGSIFIGSGVSKSKVRFWVQDGGEGIAPDDQKRIFERFARAAKSRRRSEGAGLGLSIVRAITQAHGGKIYLKSALGSGSTFTIVLPLIPLKQEVASDESNSHS
ncbi:sensor histidine kinase [Calothrix sp. PCC 6303]|uniref:sensor histidine kinase n=1 Tax=Calothrix sp. PCC 6303 TaxID=1170562 RepID=UPI0002A007E2|nr:HAMP domain-containing sensor histidine kinase [Calothrix sp. PCC 6303]AFZ01792.1 integral membrane sensor signal transduction histidine kinase [Calothrix sp. PCC 6303]